ncbi:MAG: hypothetical protein AABP62_27155 [Planctomycetota bacterium]
MRTTATGEVLKARAIAGTDVVVLILKFERPTPEQYTQEKSV